MRKIDTNAFARLGEMTQVAPPPDEKRGKLRPYTPKLNPGAQERAYYSRAKNILGWSEKGSGKTRGFVEKLVRHCVENQNALALIIVKVRTMGNKGGVWDKLTREVLPLWRKGRGIAYSDVTLDSQKNEMVWIQNKHGGWSQVVLISAPFASMIAGRAPGYEPSFILLEEGTECDTVDYYRAPAAQLGRRPGIPGAEQQFCISANPKGPSNWVYKLFFEEPYDEETGLCDPDYENIYFPSAENLHIEAGYFDHLAKVYRNDPIASARLIGGEWVEKASGDSIFGDLFNEISHVRPLTGEGIVHPKLRIKPSPRHPIILGIDSGSTHHAFSYMQRMPMDGRMKWVVFDEVVILKKKLLYSRLVPLLMRRLKFWYDQIGITKIEEMALIPISDDSAFKVFRPGSGSFDYLDMERQWNGDLSRGIPERCVEMGLPKLKIKMCPKFDGSVKARISCARQALGDETLIISAACIRHQTMLRMLESEKQKENEAFDPERVDRPRRSDHLHPFDSMTYPMLMEAVKPYELVSIRETQMLIRVA